MLTILDDLHTSQHEKWATWTTPQIQKYLKKYTAPVVPGKCSSHRRKKIKFLQNIMAKRKQAERLLTQTLQYPRNTMDFIFIRGLPGSGKSTIAQSLTKALGYKHFEADMYHMAHDTYQFDPTKTKEAHLWCQLETLKALVNKHKVVVSNTFTRLWEMQPYIDMAKSLNIPIQIIEATGEWESVHNVPPQTLQQMKDRWEPSPILA